MRKHLAVFLVIVLLISSCSIANAAQEERFSALFGVYWGDSVEHVKMFCGRPDHQSSFGGIVDVLMYNDVEFGGKDDCGLNMVFAYDKLTGIHFILFEHEMPELLLQ